MAGKTNIFIIGVIVVVLGIVGGAYINVMTDSDQAQPTGWADPDNMEMVKRGAAVYADQCGSCHGDNLQGQPNWRVAADDGILPAPPHDETGHTWHHPDGTLFEIIKLGGQKNAPQGFTSGMPPFEDNLSDADIWALLAFIKSRWPEKIRKRHAQMMERMAGN